MMNGFFRNTTSGAASNIRQNWDQKAEGKKKGDMEVFFEGSESTDGNYFLFYFRRWLKWIPKKKGEQMPSIHICVASFQILFTRFPVQGVLRKEVKICNMIKGVLKERSGRKRDIQNVIKMAISIKMRKHKESLTFIDKASKGFGDAGFAEEQKFVFLS